MTDTAKRVVRRAYEACLAGDVPDIAEGIVALLRMDGWEIVHTDAEKRLRRLTHRLMEEEARRTV
jgi:hypothetical protein